MQKAIEQAEIAAAENEVPVGAVIVRNDEIVATGRNRREQGKNALLHAETDAGDPGRRHENAAGPGPEAARKARLYDRGFQAARYLCGHELARGPDVGRTRRLSEHQGTVVGQQEHRAVRAAHDRAAERVPACTT